MKVITYVVNIDNSHNLASANRHFLVVIKDETGRQVAAPQAYRQGVRSYTFKEVGNVYGIRIASLIQEPSAAGSIALYSNSKSGPFLGGQTYLFLLGIPTGVIETGSAKD